eukprot:Selendium_serpulae@DN5484_c0_g1_i1.p1
MWRIVTLALFVPAAVAAKRAGSNRAMRPQSRRMQDPETYDESVQGYRKVPFKPIHHPIPHHGPPKTNYNVPIVKPPPVQYNPKPQPPYSCPTCPHLETYRIACRKADKLCCLDDDFIEDGEEEDIYPFEGLSCPATTADTDEILCTAFEQDSDLVKSGTRLLPSGSTTSTGDYTSNRYAAFAAIGSPGLCYNVYSGVKPGTELEISCSNSVIGNIQDVFSSLAQGASVMAGGDFVLNTAAIGTTDVGFGGSVIVMQDTTLLDLANAAQNIDVGLTTTFDGPGAFDGVCVFFGGPITLNGVVSTSALWDCNSAGSAYVYDSTDAGDITNQSGSVNVLSTATLQSFRDQYNAYMCSAYNQIQEVLEQSITTGAASESGNVLTVNCDSSGPGGACITNSISSSDLQDSTTISLSLNVFDTAIVPVTGTGALTFDAITCGASACDGLIFAFMEASSVTVLIDADNVATPFFPGIYFTAQSVTYQWVTATPTTDYPLVDSGIITAAGSTLTLSQMARSMENLLDGDDDWELQDVARYNVVFCDCACDPSDLPIKKEEKKCLKNIYGPHHKY